MRRYSFLFSATFSLTIFLSVLHSQDNATKSETTPQEKKDSTLAPVEFSGKVEKKTVLGGVTYWVVLPSGKSIRLPGSKKDQLAIDFEPFIDLEVVIKGQGLTGTEGKTKNTEVSKLVELITIESKDGKFKQTTIMPEAK